MNPLRKLLHGMSEFVLFRPFKSVFETLDGIIFGTDHRTSGGPHILEHIEIKRFMTMAIVALLPSTAAALYFWGWHVLWMILMSYVVGGIVEVAFAIIRKREIEEGFLVTGLIFPLVLPPTLPLWAVAVGSGVGVFFGKEVFGGTGRNIFNPALVGRLFITIAFPGLMSSQWLPAGVADAVTAATPLGVFKTGGELIPAMSMLFGTTPAGIGAGSMGEVFRLGIIVGGIFLLITKVGNWRVPVAYFGSLAFFGWALHLLNPAAVAPAWFQLLSGAALFGGFYMLTDPVTSPSTRAGKFIYGIGAGLLTVLIRSFSGYTEGVMFSIIFMNAVNPLIDHIVMQNKFKEVGA